MSRKNDAQRKGLKAEFTRLHGYWNPLMDSVLETSPAFFEAYIAFSSAPWRKGVLAPKVKELINVAVHATVTQLHEPGLRIHMSNALRHGATPGGVLEVLELISVLGIHAMTMGMPVLFDELRNAGRGNEIAPKPLTKRQKSLKKEFEKKRGYWSDLWDGILQLAPDFFESYLRFSSVPWTDGVLEPKIKELIYIAVDATTTHLYEPGLRLHIRNALKYGATVEEIVEVYQLTSAIGIHSLTLGSPLLLEALSGSGKARRRSGKADT